MIYFSWAKIFPMPKNPLFEKIGSKLALQGFYWKNSIFQPFLDKFSKIFNFWGEHRPSFQICYVICSTFEDTRVKSIKNNVEDGQSGSSMKVVGTAPYAHIWYQSQYFLGEIIFFFINSQKYIVWGFQNGLNHLCSSKQWAMRVSRS